jgi:probable rRNA maturation factor
MTATRAKDNKFISMNTLYPDIEQESPLWDAFPDAEAIAERALQIAGNKLSDQFRDGAELSILLSDDEHIRSVNQEWRGLDKPTNVLSFPAVEPHKIATTPFLGDIIIAYETVKREAQSENKDFADHFTHLVIHGFLHLLGYDHIEDADAEKMESLEIELLAELNIPNPYQDGSTTAQDRAQS